jgi:hypothetical protein
MLPNVDTPMTEDGWAIMVRAIRHLALVQAGGANDLNAGAVDADQIALSEFFDALSALRAESDPFPQYQLAADASSATSATASINKVSGGSQTIASGVAAAVSSYSAVGTATLSGMDVTTGIFTAPADGLYSVTGYVFPTYGAGGTQVWDLSVDLNASGSSEMTFGRFGVYPFNSFGGTPYGGIAGMKFLSSGDTIKLRVNNTGASTLTISEAHFNIARLA